MKSSIKTSKSRSKKGSITRLSASNLGTGAKVKKQDKSKGSTSQNDVTDSTLPNTSDNMRTLGLPVLPDNVLPGWIGNVVRAVCSKSEAHSVAVLVNVLSQFAALLSEPFFEYDGIKHYCRLNSVIVGNSPKSWKARFVPDVARIFDGLRDKAIVVRGHMLSGENLIFEVNGVSKDCYAQKKQTVSEHEFSDKRLLFLEKEFRSALAYAKRPGNTLAPIVSDFFNYGCAEHPTKTEMVSTKGSHVVIHANTSCTDFSILRNDVQHSNGFASYFLWFLVDRPKLVPVPECLTNAEMESFQNTIENCIHKAKGLRSVVMSNKAKKLWSRIYPSLSNDVPGVAGSVVSRTEIHSIRLALIYALAAGHKEITTQDLRAARALVMYAHESALKVFNGNQSSDNIKARILYALRAATDHEMSRTDISGIFSRNVYSADIRSAIQELVDSKEITVVKDRNTGGAPKGTVKLNV